MVIGLLAFIVGCTISGWLGMVPYEETERLREQISLEQEHTRRLSEEGDRLARENERLERQIRLLEATDR